MKKIVMAIVAGMMMCGLAMADGKALPPHHDSTTNGTFAVFTNTSPESMYLDALDLKTASGASMTWTVTIYNNKSITNTLLSAVAGAQVEWRTNMVNAVRIVPAGTMTVTTTGTNCWLSAYFSLKQ